jgi:hypothetical protein
MVGGVKAHEVFLIVTHAPSLDLRGVKCEHTTRSSFNHSYIGVEHRVAHITSTIF